MNKVLALVRNAAGVDRGWGDIEIGEYGSDEAATPAGGLLITIDARLDGRRGTHQFYS